jgi:hypothetical protein
MIKTLSDKDTDTSARILMITCAVGIAIALVYSIWRIQLATVTIREIREYAIRRDAEVFPLVHDIQDDVHRSNELMIEVGNHMKKQDDAIARLIKFVERVENKVSKE